MVEVHPTERPDGSEPEERPLLSAHPWRLPVLLAIAFGLTIAVATVVVRHAQHPDTVSQTRRR